MSTLLAVDGSPYTKKMLAYLAAHEEWLGAMRHYPTVLTVQPPLPTRVRGVLGKSTVEKYYTDEAAKVTEPVRKFLQRHGVEPRIIYKTGDAAQAIAHEADSGKYDLLVMGSHGNGALANLVMGSVATKVLASCKLPVLLIR